MKSAGHNYTFINRLKEDVEVTLAGVQAGDPPSKEPDPVPPTGNPWSELALSATASAFLVEGVRGSGKSTSLGLLSRTWRHEAQKTVLCTEILSAEAIADHITLHIAILSLFQDILGWLAASFLRQLEFQQDFDWLTREGLWKWHKTDLPKMIGWFEFERKWSVFIDRLLSSIRSIDEYSNIHGLVVMIDDIDGFHTPTQVRSAMQSLRHPKIGWIATATELIEPVDRLFPPGSRFLIEPEGIAPTVLEHIESSTIARWSDLIKPLSYSHQNVGFADFLNKSSFGIFPADRAALRRVDDPQKMLASILARAKDAAGKRLFRGGSSWMIESIDKHTYCGGTAGGTGVSPENAPGVTLHWPSTVRLLNRTARQRVDELETLALSTGVLAAHSYEWESTVSSPLVRSSMWLSSGYISIGWPSWHNAATAHAFLRRAHRFMGLASALQAGIERRTQRHLIADAIARAWAMLQVMEFEDKTSDKQLREHGRTTTFARILDTILYHSHADVGRLRYWFLRWLPVLTSPEFGLPDATCTEILKEVRRGLLRLGFAVHGSDPLRELLLQWYQGRELLLQQGNWQSVTERPGDDDLQYEILVNHGSLIARTCRLLQAEQLVLNELRNITVGQWGHRYKIDLSDAHKIVDALDNEHSANEKSRLDFVLALGVSRESILAYYNVLLREIKLSDAAEWLSNGTREDPNVHVE